MGFTVGSAVGVGVGDGLFARVGVKVFGWKGVRVAILLATVPAITRCDSSEEVTVPFASDRSPKPIINNRAPVRSSDAASSSQSHNRDTSWGGFGSVRIGTSKTKVIPGHDRVGIAAVDRVCFGDIVVIGAAADHMFQA